METRRSDLDDDVTVVGDHELVAELRRIARECTSAPITAKAPPPPPPPSSSPQPPPAPAPRLTPTLPPPPAPSPPSPTTSGPSAVPPTRRKARSSRHPGRVVPPAPAAATTVIEWDDEVAERSGIGWLVLVAIAAIAVVAALLVLR